MAAAACDNEVTRMGAIVVDVVAAAAATAAVAAVVTDVVPFVTNALPLMNVANVEFIIDILMPSTPNE